MSLFRRTLMAKKKSEWVLIAESERIIANITTDQQTFGPVIYWKVDVQYRLVGNIEITSAESPTTTRYRVSDGNTQSVHLVNQTGLPVGYNKPFDLVCTSNRERTRNALVGRLYDDNTYSVEITNFKMYKHI